jgi:hypothetical protein
VRSGSRGRAQAAGWAAKVAPHYGMRNIEAELAAITSEASATG